MDTIMQYYVCIHPPVDLWLYAILDGFMQYYVSTHPPADGWPDVILPLYPLLAWC